MYIRPKEDPGAVLLVAVIFDVVSNHKTGKAG